MKERLHDLGIKTTELSQFMKISRPSLYKYIELYESKDYKIIPEKVLRVFKYIDKYKNITKEQVITYTISEFSELNTSDKKETIRNFLIAKGTGNPKIELMYLLVTTESLDDIVQYLVNAARLLDEGDLDESALQQVSRLVNLKSDIMKGIPLTEEEINKTRSIIGE